MLRRDVSARGGAAARVLKLEQELMCTTADKREAQGRAHVATLHPLMSASVAFMHEDMADGVFTDKLMKERTRTAELKTKGACTEEEAGCGAARPEASCCGSAALAQPPCLLAKLLDIESTHTYIDCVMGKPGGQSSSRQGSLAHCKPAGAASRKQA